VTGDVGKIFIGVDGTCGARRRGVTTPSSFGAQS
jgi:hypothetical protein